MKTIFIHGFLGLPQDWSPVFEGRRIDLWKDISPVDFPSLEQAGKKLSKLVTGDNLTLVGYSLGGRIALHWPKDQWHRLRQMVLISVHGGLTEGVEKTARLQQDQMWAQRFLNEPWESVIHDWNQQDVFKADTVRPQRNSVDYDRLSLSAALTNWSLGTQEEQFAKLKSAPFSVTYCYGINDLKFSKYAQQLQNSEFAFQFCGLEAGHSVHLSHAKELAEMVSKKTT